MNKITLLGRFTSDPELKTTESGLTFTRVSLAVDRRSKKGEEKKTDFIPCLAFGKTAEVITKYFKKGHRALVIGRLQTGNYVNKDNQKIYTFDVVVEEVSFIERRSDSSADSSDGFIASSDEETYPFT